MSRIRKKALLLILIAVLGTAFAEIAPFEDAKGGQALTLEKLAGSPSEMLVLYENANFIYGYKEERDVLSVHDKRNGYTWKSGIDIPTAKAVKAALRKGDPLGFEPIEEKMNETFTGIANSLITLEYYDDSMGIKRLASAAVKEVESELFSVKGESGHFVLQVNYEAIDVTLEAHLYFTDKGYDIRISGEDISGADKHLVAAVILNPFLGASGGMHSVYDAQTEKHGDPVKKDRVEGYVLVPDGPGALIDFRDYNVSLKNYSTKVYGPNLSKETYHSSGDLNVFVPFKQPLMPLYGIAHTNKDAAFIGYAASGDEFMEIVVMPEENTTLYTWAYPRFVYNDSYYQVFNKRGEGFFSLFETPNDFDIDFRYNFIAESDALPADYVGMATLYREHLIKEEVLKEREMSAEVPVRVDFVMSDQKKSVIGLENAVVTTSDDVRSILESLTLGGVKEISSGLYGWQDGGITNGQPWDVDFTRSIGSASSFKKMIQDSAALGIDISFAQDYLKFNKEQGKFQGNAIKHISNWYLSTELQWDMPVNEQFYIRPEKGMQWMDKQVDELMKIGITSHTIEGITSSLFSDHGNDPIEEEEVVRLYQDALSEQSKRLVLNLKTPNQYLWPYTDRFLQAPMFSTKFLIESETVPFLSFVLNGTMEVHAPYSNFSFFDTKDVLKMIDYNVAPSFVLTKEASYLLSSTNSVNFYSTEYEQYKELIITTYNTVNQALSGVRNTRWIGREKIGDEVFVNRYANGTSIVINYGSSTVEYDGNWIKPQSFDVFN